jgi:hypothetical protein
MSDKRVQLWTDDTYNDFAIVLKPYILARTDEKTKYTKVIDESDQGDRYSYDWKYTLSQWVNYHLSNGLPQGNRSESSKAPIGSSEKEKSSRQDPHNLKTIDSAARPRSQSNSMILRCHFCSLKYSIEAERYEHERFWHSDKFK